MIVTDEHLNPTQILEEKRHERNNIKDYLHNKRQNIVTSRFSNRTWDENRRYIKNKPLYECIYCAPSGLSKDIPIDSKVFVLEMNIDENSIMGIGMIINHPNIHRHSVYENNDYNRYSFKGKHRISRESMNEKEEQIMKAFDILCFTGNYHMKRGKGLLSYPSAMLYRVSSVVDLVDFIYNMFKERNLFKK